MQRAQQMTPMDAFAALANLGLLTLATIGPLLIPLSSLAFTFTLPVFVILSARKRPALGRRWYLLAALPVLCWGTFLFFGYVLGFAAGESHSFTVAGDIVS